MRRPEIQRFTVQRARQWTRVRGCRGEVLGGWRPAEPPCGATLMRGPGHHRARERPGDERLTTGPAAAASFCPESRGGASVGHKCVSTQGPQAASLSLIRGRQTFPDQARRPAPELTRAFRVPRPSAALSAGEAPSSLTSLFAPWTGPCALPLRAGGLGTPCAGTLSSGGRQDVPGASISCSDVLELPAVTSSVTRRP